LQEFSENISKSRKQAEKIKNGYVTPIIQPEDAPDDILCGNVETTGKHSHSSKKHKKSKKHKFHVGEDYCADEEEPGAIHIQPNALATENISVVDSSENFSPAKGGIPKLILSRNDANKFIVKENVINSENNLKRRRSTEDNGHKLHDGKRSKSDQRTNDGHPVLMVPSIPIKLERRLSVRLEDVFGEYRLLLNYFFGFLLLFATCVISELE
jgi:hypothetical protein